MEKIEKVCALSEFGECFNAFEVTSKSPHQICCTPKHNTRLRWLRRKVRIQKALEAVEQKAS